MVDVEKGFYYGFAVGIISVVFFWALVAKVAERSKVNSGYLTFENKIYKVEFYSELVYPVKEDD